MQKGGEYFMYVYRKKKANATLEPFELEAEPRDNESKHQKWS